MSQQYVLILIPFPDKTNTEQVKLHESVKSMIVSAAADCNLVPKVLGQNDAAEPSIREKFIDSAMGAAICIVDLTGLSPGVVWELGYVRALGKQVIQIAEADQIADIKSRVYFPDSDIVGYQTDIGITELSSVLKEHLEAAVKQRTPQPSHIIKSIGEAQKRLLALSHASDLFGRCQEHEILEVTDLTKQWSDIELVVQGGQQVRQVGASFHQYLQIGGFATLYYPGQDSWHPDIDPTTKDDYDDSLYRAINENALQVDRIYILEDESQVDDENFRRRVLTDIAGGVTPWYVTLSKRVVNQNPGIKDFAIWDEELCAKVEYDQGGAGAPVITKCTYARVAPKEAPSPIVKDALRNREYLLDLMKSGDCRRAPVLHTEDYYLRRSYSGQLGHASTECRGCKDLHGPWQILKLLRMIANPRWHTKFYRESIADYIDSRRVNSDGSALRIMLCGPADYGLLYNVIESINPDHIDGVEFVVVDKCQTPLNSCEWFVHYSEAPIGISLSKRHSDILSYCQTDDDLFDLIISDGFLSDASPSSSNVNDARSFRNDVINAWLTRLKPHGRIITTARIQSATKSDNLVKIKESFVDRALATLRYLEANSEMSWPAQDYVQQAARNYAAYVSLNPINDTEELEQLKSESSGQMQYKIVPRRGESEYELFDETLWAYITIENAPSS